MLAASCSAASSGMWSRTDMVSTQSHCPSFQRLASATSNVTSTPLLLANSMARGFTSIPLRRMDGCVSLITTRLRPLLVPTSSSDEMPRGGITSVASHEQRATVGQAGALPIGWSVADAAEARLRHADLADEVLELCRLKRECGIRGWVVARQGDVLLEKSRPEGDGRHSCRRAQSVVGEAHWNVPPPNHVRNGPEVHLLSRSGICAVAAKKDNAASAGGPCRRDCLVDLLGA